MSSLYLSETRLPLPLLFRRHSSGEIKNLASVSSSPLPAFGTVVDEGHPRLKKFVIAPYDRRYRGSGHAVQIVQRHHFASHLKEWQLFALRRNFFAFPRRVGGLSITTEFKSFPESSNIPVYSFRFL
ncbi:hypothetical protein L484_003505 [Morus notabilis]|uniref:Uncharacterized protein n=1 Tax=Morus notabilis TaxID=981085 RepID=W9SPE5_9ROSA|nr:hypothetical protein L484_003505 [Morus notabilis]